MSNYTPGPWHAGGNGNGIVYASDGWAVADAITFHGQHPGTKEANARLIAAAPDLLEALQELLADKYLSDPINNDRMAKARLAVSKAIE